MAKYDPNDDPEIRELERMEAELREEQARESAAKNRSSAQTNYLVKLATQLSEIVLVAHTPPEITRDQLDTIVEELAGTGLSSGKQKPALTVTVSDRLDDTLIIREAVDAIVKSLYEMASSRDNSVAMVIYQKEPEEIHLEETFGMALSLKNSLGFSDVGWRAHCKGTARQLLKDLGVPTSPPEELAAFIAGLQEGTRTLNVAPGKLKRLGWNPSGAKQGASAAATEAGCAVLMAAALCLVPLVVATGWIWATGGNLPS